MPNKEPTVEGATAAAESREAHQANRDMSWEREAREATLATLITETVAREVSKVNMQYTAWFRVNCTPALGTNP